MADTFTVLVICGSLRKASYNAVLTRALPVLAPLEMMLIPSVTFNTFPIYNQELQNSAVFRRWSPHSPM